MDNMFKKVPEDMINDIIKATLDLGETYEAYRRYGMLAIDLEREECFALVHKTANEMETIIEKIENNLNMFKEVHGL